MPEGSEYEQQLNLSELVRNQSNRPQFPHSDYVGLSFDLANKLNLLPALDQFKELPILTPFAFRLEYCETIQTELRATLADAEAGKNLPQVIVNFLEEQQYSFSRKIDNKLDGSVSYVNGNIKFEKIMSMPMTDQQIAALSKSCPLSSKSTPLALSPDINNDHNTPDHRQFLLYKENGVVELPNRQRFEVSQHYIYHFNQTNGLLEVFFSQRDNPSLIDRHFLSLNFTKDDNIWTARYDHLCEKDLYCAKFEVFFNGCNVQSMTMTYDVKGPHKDYVLITTLNQIS